MIGIYQDNFIKYLKDRLNNNVDIKSKNIICECPWCEYQEDKDHYHLYIAIDSPIFHCFHCHQSGVIQKLLYKLDGKDLSDQYVDKERIKEIAKQKPIKIEEKIKQKKEVKIPILDTEKFKLKTLYMKNRLRFSNVSLNSLKGLVFDIDQFLELNKNLIAINETLFKVKDYLHVNFVGFLTEHNSKLVMRNIDPESTFKHFKMWIQESPFLDYYKISGRSYYSNSIVLSEGIFDIINEQIFDSTNLRSTCKLYATALSSSYNALIKSIVFYEQIFRPDVFILSDRDIELNKYRSLKKFNSHIINSLTVFYNKSGKDFADVPNDVEKIII